MSKTDISRALVLTALPLTYVGTLHAAGWEVTPSVGAGLIYTDNVTLAEANEEEEYVAEVTAGISASRSGGRFNTDINYSVQGLAFAEESDRNSAFHQLDAEATLEVSREQFFIDAESNITQQVIDPRRADAGDNIGVNNNRASVFTATVGPRLQQRFGNRYELLANYQVSVVEQFDADDNAAAANIDSTQNSSSVSFGNIADSRRLQWFLLYEQTQTENDNNIETREEAVSLNAFYPLTTTVTLIGVVGEENNNFARAPGSEEPEGSFWEAGIRWQPSPRDTVELRGGERFFGDTYSFQWQHQGQRANGNITYTEDVTTTTDNLLNDDNTDLTQFTGEATITRQLDIGVGISLPKSDIGFNVFATRNEFQATLTEDETYGAGVTWQWRFAPRTQLNTDLTGQKSEFNDNAQENENTTFNIGVSRRLSPVTNASLTYTYSKLDSNVAADEFEVNTLAFRISRTF